ncbi:aminotransferase class I/II-fold pyridoxal phosphate-dependent enzyme [Streptomyces capillispiralis]|uniref:GntR family transcriptional regulator n=1 Tax=Streptomyces capillispiralis TaxID=68182 RepID=A0A561SGN8_9ACTN|nr:aminotransferase class I/II-fold pyridoxal phosphate-dependent enzyme [Streptomyces capillispiralis]TWF74036.1 GntR family transcriptional regulator [Streptomyces capillispiralis]GHE24023.1 transcriptional regulator PtsJ [Streptomyces capillispiralis]
MDITGRTAGEIAASIRALSDAGKLTPGAVLPPVRRLAGELGVNRNTVMAAYRQLIQAGVAVGRGRAGTVVAEAAGAVDQEGRAAGGPLRDVGHGNPDPAWLPDLHAVRPMPADPVLYGEPTVDPALSRWALPWLTADQPRTARLTVTGGAVDAVERLLNQTLAHGDAVALEDPCFLSSINTVRLAGYRPLPVPVDAEGMTVDGLRSALDQGARAVVCTPRAHNPTGVSLSAARAKELRAVLAGHRYVLVIEDDHFSLLSDAPYRSVVPADHARWALVRSVSKFLGPDLRIALVASDLRTAQRLAARIGPGRTWTSHLLQRLAAVLLTDPAALALIDGARTHYAERNARFAQLLRARGVGARAGDGLNLWVPVGVDARAVSERLLRRGWLARTGDSFVLHPQAASAHLRLTVHQLGDDQAVLLADDLAEAVGEVSLYVGYRPAVRTPFTG